MSVFWVTKEQSGAYRAPSILNNLLDGGAHLICKKVLFDSPKFNKERRVTSSVLTIIIVINKLFTFAHQCFKM